MRYFMDIAYKGTAYHGWQRQLNAMSVQETIETSIETILGVPTEVVGSGRTDAGVHALQQIAHFDSAVNLDPDQTVYKFNAVLPPDIVVKQIRPVQEEAHARFDAELRGYEYRIRQTPVPFGLGEYYLYTRKVDINPMNEACQLFLGEHDFESFSRVKTEVNHFRCKIFEARWTKDNEHLIFFVNANRFLRGMVRAMVGTLLEVGLHKMEPERILQVMACKDRKSAGAAAPPEGLFLSRVEYPEHIYMTDF